MMSVTGARDASLQRIVRNADDGCDLCPRVVEATITHPRQPRSNPGRARPAGRATGARMSRGQLLHERLHRAHRFEDSSNAPQRARATSRGCAKPPR